MQALNKKTPLTPAVNASQSKGRVATIGGVTLSYFLALPLWA